MDHPSFPNIKHPYRDLGIISISLGVIWMGFFLNATISSLDTSVNYCFMPPIYWLMLEMGVGLLGIIGGILLLQKRIPLAIHIYHLLIFVSAAIPLISFFTEPADWFSALIETGQMGCRMLLGGFFIRLIRRQASMPNE